MFKWTDYLTLAEALAQRPDEASQRSSVSRAYYACFCSARNRLCDEGYTVPKTGKAHKIVWDKFEESLKTQRQKIGLNGRRLKRSRRSVDYDNLVPDLPRLVEDALILSGSLFSGLRSL